MKRHSYLLARPEKTDDEDQYEAIHLSGTFLEKRLSLEGVRNEITSGRVDDAFWQSIASRCFECGACVYQCPLCTCFNVMDRAYDTHIERIRIWDTCLFKGFTRLSPGILPNKEEINRIKRWHYHKVIYYPEQMGTFGCVGCGRCTIACPGAIDMATVGLKISKGLAVY
jgi:heterodisulfide reductase subunit C